MTTSEILELQKISTLIDIQWFASAEEEGRTEKATETKLKKAREEGRVAKSPEISGALVMLFPVICLILLAPWIFNNCVRILEFYFTKAGSSDLSDPALYGAFITTFAKIVLPISVTAMIAGIVGNVVQTRGFIFSTKPIEPKFSKIIPKFGEFFRRTLFSFTGLFNIFKSIFKVVILSIVAWLVLKRELPVLLSLQTVGLYPAIIYLAKIVAKLLIIAAVFFLVIAIPDYLVQRHEFMEKMKMSKQDIKEEYKNMEGDPLIKSRLRQYMREMLTKNIQANVAKADVVITNPTHYAVAIQYDKTVMQGPMVVAKGVDNLAQRIKEIARENDVQIVENRPLARALYAEVEIGDIIPETYYQALALILSRVYTMKRN